MSPHTLWWEHINLSLATACSPLEKFQISFFSLWSNSPQLKTRWKIQMFWWNVLRKSELRLSSSGLSSPWVCHHDGIIAIKLGLRYTDHKDVPELSSYFEMFTFMISIKNILQSPSSKINAVLKDLFEFFRIFCFSHLIKPIRTMFILDLSDESVLNIYS